MRDLLVDSQIRGWVFLPIVVITFLVGIVRHYVSILLQSEKKIELQLLQDSQVILRSRLLRENSGFIPKSSFLMRRHFFNNEVKGYLMQKRRPPVTHDLTDPAIVIDMLKGNITNVLPTIIIGGWIHWMFSGFITTRVPFPLTLRFKPMLQRGIELMHLDASWVSSASWYFLNVIGLRSIYALVLGEDNRADQVKQMQDPMSGETMLMPQDPKVVFKEEWEALEIIDHQWCLQDVENEIAYPIATC